jgi:hypothetical protein
MHIAHFHIGLIQGRVAGDAYGDDIAKADAVQAISDVLSVGFDIDGFSVSDQIGYWEGKPEQSIRVSVSADGIHIISMRAKLAAAFAQWLNQDAVLVEYGKHAYLVENPQG